MQIAPETLRAAFEALSDAHSYLIHPQAVRPSTRVRIATHKLETARFHALDREARAALKALSDLLQAEPTPA